jgi:hypothetical protein
LAGDRRRCLIARAHGAGLIDYTKFNSYNGLDLIREKMLLDLLHSQEEAEVIKLQWQKKLLIALMAPDQTKRQAFENLDEVYQYFLQMLSPWDQSLASSTMKRRDPEALKSAWEETFGRLDDPETQRKLKLYDDFLAETQGKKSQGRP